MNRAVALPVTLLATAIITVAADPSAKNKSDEPDAFDIEPAILKQNLSAEPLPATGTPDAEDARLEKQLERAKRNADGAERLYNIGVLANRERAELEAAEANVRRKQKLLKVGSADKTDVDRAQEKLAELKSPKN